uniref:Cytosolic carboxypeptidase N-terminal domain-containing protein n=1 Tax=Meloidogyne javanica TaxID=6303 RepID=A0A915MQN1_MELJA
MAKLMECLIIFSKNQKNKLLFIRHNILPILKLIFETNFPKRLINLNYQQIVFISLATLRQFAKIEECREQLFKLNILKMCENFIEDLAGNFNERKTKIEKMENFLENNFKENGGDDAQLYDSLCSLCLRCLPSKEFPYRLDDFPLKFVLPLIETKNKKILSKLPPSSSSQIVNNFKLSNLVDESDEDSNLWPFNSFSLNNLEEEEDEFALESSKQLIFDEFTNNECCQINEYKQIVLKEWKKINSVGNFVKIANPELSDCGDLINGKEENICENSVNNSINRFESGNLWKAIQVGTNKYELIISPDINQQTLHFQWFYFEVTNMRAGIPYIFEIINCLKNISMFSKGMQPVLFSLIEAKKGNIGFIQFLLSSHPLAIRARDLFIFKIIPMLNPDG